MNDEFRMNDTTDTISAPQKADQNPSTCQPRLSWSAIHEVNHSSNELITSRNRPSVSSSSGADARWASFGVHDAEDDRDQQNAHHRVLRLTVAHADARHHPGGKAQSRRAEQKPNDHAASVHARLLPTNDRPTDGPLVNLRNRHFLKNSTTPPPSGSTCST